jgi:hypothetical protein
MVEGPRPYVISADVNGLLQRWTPKRNLSMPKDGLIDSQREELQATIQSHIGHEVIVVGESMLRAGMTELIRESELPVISLDRAYLDGVDLPNLVGHIDLTRPVNENFSSLPIQPRPGYPSEEEQLDQFVADSPSPVVLLDDVLFHGESVKNIFTKLEKRNRPVKKLIAGISIEAGRRALEAVGIEVVSLIEYGEVFDEVCERDFRAGVPMSGRTVYASSGEVYSAPYFYPFGDVVKWGSIPEEHAQDVSSCCLEQSIELWRSIEKESGRRIPTAELPRQIQGLSHEESIVFALEAFR